MVLPSAKCPGSAIIVTSKQRCRRYENFFDLAVFCVKSWKTGRAMAPDHIQCNQTFFSGFNS